MKKYLVVLLLLINTLTVLVFGQKTLVTGTITSAEDGTALPGANVFIKGTENGTTTNIDGLYTLEISQGDSILVFSFVGMQSQEVNVNGKTQIDVVLQPSAIELQQVVVTALGIKRESKALGYSASTVNSEEITESRDRSILNSLQGKIAGVDISNSSGAPGSSTRILLRGVSSLGGSNQPLFVVDGVPVNNSFSGSTSINGGTDFGNGINDINPDDIETINFLKGAAGAALYGARAANGVIIITTKKGQVNTEKNQEITITSSLTLEEPLRLVNYQNEFGQGIYGDAVNYENTSWGPRFDDKLRYWGNEVDNTLRVKAYKGLPRNVREFFDTGISYNNSLSISGGNELSTYYLSYSNINHDGIFPTDADSYKRHTLALRGSTNFSDKFTASSSINYIRKNSKYVSTGQGEQSVYDQVMQTPRDISLIEQKDIDSKWNNLDNYYSLYTVNPYFILERNGNFSTEDRIFGNLDFTYNFSKLISVIYRVGGDISNDQFETRREKIEPGGNNEFASVFESGERSRSSSNSMQLNSDLIIKLEKKIQDFDINALIGHNLNQRESHGLYAISYSPILENYNNLSNSSENFDAGESSSLRRLVGVYSNVDFSYKNLVYLGLTARNDWSSTLSLQNNSYFYPGANLSFVFSELINKQRILPFGKLRVSWTQVGNDAPAYRIGQVFVQGGHSDGYGSLRYPLPYIENSNSFEVSNLIGNEDLKPELITEFEVGTDLRFLNNRFGLDFTYYDKTTTDLIWAVPLSPSSGYTFKTINLGKLTNKGVEAMLNITPVKLTRFKWDLSFNYSVNRNKLVELNEELDRVVLNGISVEGGQQINYIARPGEPVGIFEARTVMRDSQGRIVVDNTGLPKAAEDLVEYGNREYKYIAGILSQITWRNFSLSAGVDIKQGGIMYSRTKDVSTFAGTTPQTLYNMREPFIIPNSVYETGTDANGDPIYAENNIPIGINQLVEYWDNGGLELDGNSLVDKSYIKLREVIVSYSVPGKIINRIGIKDMEFSVIGRNLLLYTPENQTFIDPELTTFGTDINADFGEYSAQPTVRSVTFSIRLVL